MIGYLNTITRNAEAMKDNAGTIIGNADIITGNADDAEHAE